MIMEEGGKKERISDPPLLPKERKERSSPQKGVLRREAEKRSQ